MKDSAGQLRMRDREQWRAWLVENHATAMEIWLVFFKKHTGRPRPWNVWGSHGRSRRRE